ncbi:aminotransferase [Gracilibacillus salinarum]|uniref:Aminotransferase n=1 Tax=Gracilibacillus salinarum TaxID=2932255 RepID=A0ABY4GM96_9BACI|nr:aminotransferase [Gracilibacillus salinarum]UOQ84872.1 aminotransferase [Gracilibacillus salinarum]
MVGTLIKTEQKQEHLWHALNRFNPETRPMVVSHGEGAWFTAESGEKYFDGVSGLWCLNLGHGQKEIVEAAANTMMNLSYSPLTLSHQPAIDLSAKISETLGASYKTFFANSGSEANETAFKIARQYHKQNGNPEKYKIISRYRAYHGTTLGALSATAQANRRMKYDPGVPGFLHVVPPYSYRCMFDKGGEGSDLIAADMLEQTIVWEGEETVAAVIMEPIISGGGVLVPSPKYLQRVQAICEKYDVLLIMDEVVSGFGRTGKMFGFMHSEGVQPDIVTMAKGLTSGYLPLGATAVQSYIYEKFKGDDQHDHFRHVSTYGGHPASCAVALKNIEIIEREQIVDRVEKLGNQILDRLRQLENLPYVGECRRAGFLCGIELVENKLTKAPASDEKVDFVIQECKKKGIIIGKNGDTVPGYSNVLIIAPPLISKEEDLQWVVDVVTEAIQKLV